MNVPHCPAHGDTCMPMLRVGCWWCPTGGHIVITPIAVPTKRPRIFSYPYIGGYVGRIRAA